MTTSVYGKVQIVDSDSGGTLAKVTFAGGWTYQIEKVISLEMPQVGDEIFIALRPSGQDRHRVTIWRNEDLLTQYWITDRHILSNSSAEFEDLYEKTTWALLPGPGFLERCEGIQWCRQLWETGAESTFQPYPLIDTEPTEDRGETTIVLPPGEVSVASVLSVCGWRRVNGLHVPLLFVEVE